jgi:hypothetical protein
MWAVKTKVILVITEATGTISKSLTQYLSNKPGKHEMEELHKPAILCTAHRLWEVLNGRNNITFSADCKYRTAATLCTI